MGVESMIRFLSGPLTEKTISLQKSQITIGRDPQNDICVQDPKVSRLHARISHQGDSWSIENLSQTSFVAVNQHRVQQSGLQHNTIIKLGESTSFVFLIQQSMPMQLPPTPDSTEVSVGSTFPLGSPPVQVAPNVGGAGRQPTMPTNATPTGTVLLSMSEPGTPSLAVSSNVHSSVVHYQLNKPVINIGRDPGNEIAPAEGVVSGRHAQIVREGNNLFLVHPHPDRPKTLNGLWYQGIPIRGDQRFRQQLAHGDIFRIGSDSGTMVTFAFDDGSGASTEKS